MKFYKFRIVDTYSLSALSTNNLWFSTANDFNDPFEGAHILNNNLSSEDLSLIKAKVKWKSKDEIGKEEYREMLEDLGVQNDNLSEEDLFKKITEHDLAALIDVVHNSKITCLSLYDNEKDPLKENLMWSHYSDGLRGFCLVFDARKLEDDINKSTKQSMRIIQVKYQDEPNELSLSDYIKSESILNETNDDYLQSVTETITTKSKDWEYENEVRILAMSKLNLHTYSPEALVEIVVGERMPEEQKKLVIDTAKNANPDIIIKQARLKPDSYQLEIVSFIM